MLSNSRADRSGGSAPPAGDEDGATRTDRIGERRPVDVHPSHMPPPIYASLTELVRKSLLRSLSE